MKGRRDSIASIATLVTLAGLTVTHVKKNCFRMKTQGTLNFNRPNDASASGPPSKKIRQTTKDDTTTDAEDAPSADAAEAAHVDAPRADAPRDLDVIDGVLFDEDLSQDEVRERLPHFPVDTRLPIWKTTQGWEYFRLPEVPRTCRTYNDEKTVLVYKLAPVAGGGYMHYYMNERELQRTDETDALATAMARVYYSNMLTIHHSKERVVTRAMLLRDYHPDKTGGSNTFDTVIQYILQEFLTVPLAGVAPPLR